MKMRSKVLCAVLLVIFVSVAFSAAFAERGDGKEKPVEDMEIGYVIPYEIGWYTYFVQGFELVCEDHGIKTGGDTEGMAHCQFIRVSVEIPRDLRLPQSVKLTQP